MVSSFLMGCLIALFVWVVGTIIYTIYKKRRYKNIINKEGGEK